MIIDRTIGTFNYDITGDMVSLSFPLPLPILFAHPYHMLLLQSVGTSILTLSAIVLSNWR
jgi:hypothetical protein